MGTVRTWPPLSHEIHDNRAILTTLKVIETEVGQFSSSKTAAERDRDDRPVTLAFEGFGIRSLPQGARIGRRQAISEPDAQFLDAVHATDPGGEFRAQQTGVGRLVSQPSNCSQPHVDGAWSEIPRFEVNSVPQHDSPIE
jgi:hypothetical protein